jgi:hypothetical protein
VGFLFFAKERIRVFGKREIFLAFRLMAVLGISFFARSASAVPGNENNAPAAGKKDAVSAKPKLEESGNNAGAAAAHVEVELREVKELLRAQLQRIEALEEELRLARGSGDATSALEPVVTKTASASAGPQVSLEKRLESDESKLKNVGPFSFSGDLRLRDEPFFGGPTNQSLVRHRERFRLRFNANVGLNDDISGGFLLASGDLNDPISTNQTTNQFYTRKPFAIDRAFISYRPHYFKPLTLTGGKFAYPWYNTELVWDKDLNPEGLAQTLSWNFEETPVLRKIALVGFELPFAEVAGVSVTNKSVVQSVVYGGQLQSVWQLAGWLKFSAFGGFYNYHNADSIAFALATASLGNPQTPSSGLLKLNQNSVQNSITTVTKATVVTANSGPANTPTALPTGVTSIQSAQFASKFDLLDAIARFDVNTRHERWPIAVIGDYVQNTRACANVGNIPTTPPTNTTTATFTLSTNAVCDPHERRGYWLEGRFGSAEEKGDWQFAYTRMFIEREAVLGAFNASDIRQNSNVSQHRVEAFYQAHKNVQLAFTGYIGRPLNFGGTAPPENLLKRLQFDVIYKF